MAASASRLFVAMTLAVPLSCRSVFSNSGLPGASLPEVENVLSKAKDKATDFAEQARMMQEHVQTEQARSRATLNTVKSQYELKLKVQDEEIENITKENTRLHNEIDDFARQNQNLLAEAQRVADANANMRRVLGTVTSKVDTAEMFLKESMEKLSDLGAPDLRVMQPTTPKPTLENFLKLTQEKSTVSLFQATVKRRSPSGQPGDQVKMLAAILEDMASAEQDAAAQLKASFMESFAAGQKRKEALFFEQKNLTQQWEQANSTHTQLLSAKQHLEATFHELSMRMHSLRVFARKVDELAYTALKDNKADGGVAGRTSTTAVETTAAVSTTPVPSTSSTTTTTSRSPNKEPEAHKGTERRSSEKHPVGLKAGPVSPSKRTTTKPPAKDDAKRTQPPRTQPPRWQTKAATKESMKSKGVTALQGPSKSSKTVAFVQSVAPTAAANAAAHRAEQSAPASATMHATPSVPVAHATPPVSPPAAVASVTSAKPKARSWPGLNILKWR